MRASGAAEDDIAAHWRHFRCSYAERAGSLQRFGPIIIGDEGRLLNAS